MAVKNFMELLTLIENQVGWKVEETERRPLWKQRTVMAGRLKKAAAERPELFTLENLEFTVHWLHRNRIPLKSPYGVIYKVEQALRESGQVEQARPITELIDNAIRLERVFKLPDTEEWQTRLNRAFGPYRKEVYQEWLDTRGHRWVT